MGDSAKDMTGNNPLGEVFEMYDVENTDSLFVKFVEEDQQLMLGKGDRHWDYEKDYPINKAKEVLDKLDLDKLDSEEKRLCQEMLWLWNHHALQSAIWIHKDKQKALEFSQKAVDIQPEGHPNKITLLYYHLLRGNNNEINKLLEEIGDEEIDAASQIVEQKDKWFK